MNAENRGPAVLAPVRHRVVVNTSVEQAFRVFTDGFGTWWPKEHTISRAPVEQAIIEPRAGGRCYDRAADGSECDWDQVLVWEPPGRFVLAWQVDGTWSYEPEVEHASRVTVTFVPAGDRTEVTLVHDEFERHRHADPELADGVRDGWGGALRSFSAAAESAAGEQAAGEQAASDSAPGDLATPVLPALKYLMTYAAGADFASLARLHIAAHRERLGVFHARGDLLGAASRVTIVTWTDRSRRGATRHKRVVTAPLLDKLHGPASGVVELPHRLFWQPDRHVDLDDPALLRWTYETVLREAATVEELETWLDGPTLIRVWPRLYLPRWVRQAWQQRHPELAAQAPASPSKLSA